MKKERKSKSIVSVAEPIPATPEPPLPKKVIHPELSTQYDYLAIQPVDGYRLMQALSDRDQGLIQYH
jgi:hypothetical protein